MSRGAYYNERDPYAAKWLRALIANELICPGDVDERDIRDVKPSDLAGYAQHHFFAGLGGWSRALRLARWPDDRRAWTGSCPCQPFSAAGRGGGFADERHLWPHWHHLIRECGPAVVFGEQVASKDGLAWLDLVQADLEGEGYAVGAFDLCAAGVGAPHIRQRLWFVADANGQHGHGRRLGPGDDGREFIRAAELRGGKSVFCSLANSDNNGQPSAALGKLHDAQHQPEPRGGMGHADGARWRRRAGAGSVFGGFGQPADASGMGDPGGSGLPPCEREELRGSRRREEGRAIEQPGCSFWSERDWLPCKDGKWRPVEPGTFPLAHGIPNRVGRLRAYGNAIVPQVAAEIISSYLENEAERAA